jgi:hypothetical protein
VACVPAGPALTQQRRLTLVRRYLTADQEPVPARAAACLLLYAQPLSRIHRLTTADLIDTGPQLHLRLGDPPSPVPEPFAALLRELPRAPGSPWLFPWRLPGLKEHETGGQPEPGRGHACGGPARRSGGAAGAQHGHPAPGADL